MDNDERMTTWCRMWSEDPTLAHRLMTEDCAQWASQTPVLDTVIGPDQAVAAMTALRAEQVNLFTPRVLADGGDTFAYLWDVRHPDGVVRTGLDVNVLRDGAIAENWTFVAEHDDRPDPADTQPTDAGLLADLATASVRERGGELHRAPIVDAARGRVAVLWTAQGSGWADLLVVRDGRVSRTWSFGGERAFRY
ncbi:hypothetical protein [Jatrophihabitans endophyticus]|nr:hypothetical protein [Jatrophihabitans endophyticus]